MLTEEEKERIMKLIEDNFSESWEVTDQGDFINLDYNDAYETTIVEIGKKEKYYIIDETADKDEEIIHPSACHEPCDEASEENCEKCERIYHEECKKWNAKPEVVIKTSKIEITIEAILIYEKCYTDVPHEHTYKGYRIRYETEDINILLSILADLVDLESYFISIYNYLLDVNRTKLNEEDFFRLMIEDLKEDGFYVLDIIKCLMLFDKFLKFTKEVDRETYIKILTEV